MQLLQPRAHGLPRQGHWIFKLLHKLVRLFWLSQVTWWSTLPMTGDCIVINFIYSKLYNDES